MIDRSEEFFGLVKQSLPNGFSSNVLLPRIPNESIITFHKSCNHIFASIRLMGQLVSKSMGPYLALAQHHLLKASNTEVFADAERRELDQTMEEFCETSNAELKELTILAKGCTNAEATPSQIQHTKQLVLHLTAAHKRVIKKILDLKKTYSLQVAQSDEQLCPDSLKSEAPIRWHNPNTRDVDARESFFVEEEDDLSEREELVAENRQIFQEFENDYDQSRIIESKMSEIAEMSSVFASKITEQHDALQQIGDNVETSITNVVSGKKHLIRAEENTGTGSRFLVYVLLIFSFILLFLDWHYT